MNDERRKILEMVQSGKLSAQEAIILLEALEGKSGGAAQPAVPAVTGDAGSSDGPESESGSEESSKKKEDDIYSQFESAGEKIYDFVNQAFKKIKSMDLQFTQSIDVTHVFQQSAEEIERVEIDVANGPVRLVSWEQDEVRVECQAKVFRSDDVEAARTYFLDNTIFKISNGFLHFGTQSKWMKVDTVIHVPHKQYRKIAARIFNGGITVEDFDCSQLSIKTTNGKVDVSNLSGEHFDIETVNGQINLHETRSDRLEAETVNGAIEVTGTIKGAELQSFNGNITCRLDDDSAFKIDAKAVTGNISVAVQESATIEGDIRSNLGNYKLDLEGINILHEKKELIQKQVTFKRTGSSEKTLHLLADTKTGSVTISKAD